MNTPQTRANSAVIREELEALVRFCQRYDRPFPPRRNIATRFKMTTAAIDGHICEMIKDGRIKRISTGRFEVPQLPPLPEVV